MNPELPSDDTSQTQICFFDLEAFDSETGQGRTVLEFGAILVCPRTLVELESYPSLVRPNDLSSVPLDFLSRRGITLEEVAEAPSFSKIADQVHHFLHGRVWAGHNIERFDCVVIREAFEKIGRPAPEPKGIIDSWTLLTRRFGKRRAGDMKMATLANYFQIGKQKHRSLDDVRMNLDVIKHCAAVLFLESSLPDILTADSAQPYPSDMDHLENEGKTEALQSDVIMEENPELQFPDEMAPETAIAEGSSGYEGFLKPDEVSEDSIGASLIPYHSGGHRIILLRNVALQLFCPCLRVRLGIREKYTDQHTGLPHLSFVVDASQSLCRALDACDSVAKQMSENIGSHSKWRPLVDRKYSTVRLHIRSVINEGIAQYDAEIHQTDFAAIKQKLEFNNFNFAELANLFRTGTYVDAFLSFDTFDYNQLADEPATFWELGTNKIMVDEGGLRWFLIQWSCKKDHQSLS